MSVVREFMLPNIATLTAWTGRSVQEWTADPDLWSAIRTLLAHGQTLCLDGGDSIRVQGRSSPIHTPSGVDQMLWTIAKAEKNSIPYG